MKKAVILLSGGLDSTTCVAWAKHEGYTCYALSIYYQQKHHAELNAAKKIAAQFQVERHEILELPLGQLGGSALTDHQIDVPNHVDSTDIPATYVPARNTIFLSLALSYAEIIDADAIFIGASAVDFSHYPDCRPEYISAFQHLIKLATKKGAEGKTIELKTPLMQLSKAKTIELGHQLGVNYHDTVSCYRATPEGLACGECDSCYLRKKGFLDAGIPDETKYV